jgi:hypothetical protein
VTRWWAAAAAAAVAVLAAGGGDSRPQPRPAGGFTFTAWWHDEYGGERAARSLAELAGTGARVVALVATSYQDTPDASFVGSDPERTPSDASLATAAALARAHGLRVRLRLLVDTRSGEPRVTIAPADPAAWFASYAQRVRHYARLARRIGARSLEIGAELKGVSRDAERWRALVAVARSEFRGRVSYAANWDEVAQVTWWDAVDEIGVDAWFPLAAAPAPEEDAVVAAWQPHLDALGALAARFDRPVVFSELGYSSAAGALVEPWRRGDVYSAEEQVTALLAAFRALAGQPWVRAVYLWHWSANPDAGGPGDTDHTVQGKPAEGVVRAWLATRCASRSGPR